MRERIAHVLVVSCLALAACGGDDDETASTSPATASPGDATIAGDATNAPTAPPATVGNTVGNTAGNTAGDTASTAAATAPASTGGSSCSVTVTGDVSAEWTSDAGGPAAFVYGDWLTDPSPDDEGAFAVNCFDSDFNIVSFTAEAGAEIAMEPATYDVAGPGADSAIIAEVALLFDEGLWETAGGTLEIVEFDDAHIRATFSLEIQDAFDDGRTAEVTGEFAHSR